MLDENINQDDFLTITFEFPFKKPNPFAYVNIIMAFTVRTVYVCFIYTIKSV